MRKNNDSKENRIERDKEQTPSVSNGSVRRKRKGSAKGASRRKSILFAVVVALVLVGGTIWLLSRQDRVVQLLYTQKYEDAVLGEGVLAFDEMTPAFLVGQEFTLDGIDVGQRVPKDTTVATLSESQLELARAEVLRLQSKASTVTDETESASLQSEIDYLDATISTKLLLAPQASFVSNQLDGYETLLTPTSLKGLDPGELDLKSITPTSMPGLKFVDNRTFYLGCEIAPHVTAIPWEIGQSYTLTIDGDTEVHAKLTSVKQNDDNAQFLVFSVTEKFSALRDKRSVDVRILRNTTDAFSIPLTSVFSEGEKDYCYVLDEDGVAQKTEVTMLGVTEEGMSLIVEAYDESARGQMDGRQLQRFDDVVVNPDGIKEGVMY